MSGSRYNEGKPEYSLIDYQSLEPMVRVLMFGRKKYDRNNWRKGLNKLELLDSLQRHIGDLIDRVNQGEDEVDPESGEHIIGHILANASFFSYHTGNNSFTNPSNELTVSNSSENK